jgi:hypothetical protein
MPMQTRLEGRIETQRLIERLPELTPDSPFKRGVRAQFHRFLSYQVRET